MSDNATATALQKLVAQVEATNVSLNDFFLCTVSMIIYFMQCGFAFLEAGAVRSKNVTNILIKNILDSFIGGIAYYLIGYALGFGEPGNAFCGDKYWALSNLPAAKFSHVFFHFVFAATAATIVSGAVAERCEFTAYLLYTALITGCMYPIVTHWAWSPSGWLAQGMTVTFWDNKTVSSTYMDFAGSGVVHVLGGTAALVAAAILKPRLGRFDAGRPSDIRGHSVPLVSLGGFVLFFGFYAFNGGSQASITADGDGQVVALAMVNTCLSGSAAAFGTMVVCRLRTSSWSLLSTINGGLAGMVAICAGCNIVRPWGAVVIGGFAGLSYMIWAWLVVKLRVDDPLEAVGVHLGGGFLGVLSVPFFHTDKGVFISPTRQAGMDLLWQLIGVSAIAAWSACVSLVIFGGLQLFGVFRVPAELEEKGLDIPKHGEPAYPLDAYGHGWGEKLPELSMSPPPQQPTQKRRQKSQHSFGQSTSAAQLSNDKSLPEVAAAFDTAEAQVHDNAAMDLEY